METKKQFQQILGWVVGSAVGFYCGFIVLIPLVGWFLAASWAKNSTSRSFKPLIPAMSTVCSQGFWMLVAVIFLTFLKGSILVGLTALGLDLAVILAGITWLLLRPGLGPVIFLAAYEFLGLVVNVADICATEIGSSGNKGLVLHIALRLAALWFLFTGYRGYRKFKSIEIDESPAEIISQIPGTGPVHVLTSDGQQAVHEEAHFRHLLVWKSLGSATHFWREGMADWQPINQLTLPK